MESLSAPACRGCDVDRCNAQAGSGMAVKCNDLFSFSSYIPVLSSLKLSFYFQRFDPF